MSFRLRALLVASFAVTGLVLGLGTASADEPDNDAPSGQGNAAGAVLDKVNEITRPVIPPVVNDIIGGLYG